jgi:hypothetical protein
MGDPVETPNPPEAPQPTAAGPALRVAPPQLNWLRGLTTPCACRRGILTLAVLGLGIGSGLSNPNRRAYEAYATDQASGFLLQEICQKRAQAPDILAQALQQGCHSLAQGNRADIQRFIHQQTQDYNFGVMSLYTTELPGYQLRTIGLWNNFFIVSLGS